MDADSEILIEYLRRLPADEVVPWASDHLGADEPWATRWVDVRTVDPDAPDTSWAWTILGPDDPDECDPEQLWCFSWPYDLDVYELWEAPTPPRIMPRLLHEVPIARGRSLPDRVDRALRAAADQPDRDMAVFGGWSVDALGDALHDWTTRNADRGDLRFRWDPSAEESETLQTVRTRAASDGPFRDLGDGLVIHDEALDELLRLDPDEAAEIEEHVQDVLRRARGEYTS